MAEQRLIDANILLDKCESLYMRGHILFHGVTAYAIENAHTIDPETLPIVRQLREELDRVKAEREAAVKDLETAMKIDSEVDDIGLSCFLCHVCSKNDACDGPCEPKWRGTQKEATP